MASILTALLIGSIFLVALGMRTYPLLDNEHQGSDAYYFLLCREIFREQRKIPITLPKLFVLEYSEQWYPPGFTVFLSVFTDSFIQRNYWLITPIVDSFFAALLALFVTNYFDSYMAGSFAGLFYAFSTTALPETQYLTSRQLGAGLFSITIVSALLIQAVGVGILTTTMLLFFGVMLLMTHKFSTQGLYITVFVLAVGFGYWLLLALLIFIILITLLLSRGFYSKVLRSHWDYISFWSKNWHWLGAHQVDDSPIYMRSIHKEKSVYSGGMKEKINFLFDYSVHNFYFIAPLSLLMANSFGLIELPVELKIISQASLVVLLIGVLSFALPCLRGIGFALQYSKLAMPLGAIASSWLLFQGKWWILLSCILMLSNFMLAYNWLAKVRRHRFDKDVGKWNMEQLNALKKYFVRSRPSLVFCLPNNWCDPVAYYCRVPVLWGGHGSPTSALCPICPILRKRIEDIVSDYGVSHLLLDTRYTSSACLELPFNPVLKINSLEIYELSPTH